VKAVADQPGRHGKPLDDPEAAIVELGGIRHIHVAVAKPEGSGAPHPFPTSALTLPSYEPGTKEATRKAFGDALVALGKARGEVVAIDGEVGNSTYTELFADALPDRFFQAYIAEQQLIATAIGMQVRGWKPFAATFAAFLSRAYDFVRMAAVSRASFAVAGSHAGVSIGEDGPSQMALEDLASFRAIHGSTVLYPSDPNQTAALVPQMADRAGVVFMRTTREKTPILYEPGEEFHIGGSRVVRQTDDDTVTLIGAGITLHEAVKAADQLAGEGIAARVIDLYSLKPMDAETVRAAGRATGAIVTVEDHWPEGGIGDAVLDALAAEQPHPVVVKLAVRSMPGSGTPAELLAAAGIDATHIADAARELVGRAGARGRSKAEVGSGRRE
jgi:transketolase